MLVRYRYLERLDVKKYYRGNKFNLFLESGYFINDKIKIDFEKQTKKYLNNNEFLGVSSGTNAIYLIFKYLNFNKTDEVIVPCLSWISSFTAVSATGCKVIGADIDENLHLDEDDLKRKINKNTKAVLFVHFSGLCKNLTNIRKYLKKKNILLIEDCAQSFGARTNNKFSGSFGDFSAFSMNPMKIFGCLGEAGGISFKNKKLTEEFKILRYAGIINKEYCKTPEINHKIDNIHCYALKKNLKNINTIIKKRINIAKIYNQNLTNKIIKPVMKYDLSHNYFSYTIRVKHRDKLIKYLNKCMIETKINHKFLINQHPPFKKWNKKKFKKGSKIVKEILSLPIDENMNKKEIFYVINSINLFYKNSK